MSEIHGRGGAVGVVARYTLANSALPLAALVTSPLIARALGPEGRGDVATVTAPYMLLGVISMLGLPWVVSRLAGTGWLGPRTARAATAVALGTALLGTAVGWALAPLMLHGRQHDIVVFRIVILTIPVLQLLNVYRGAVLALRMYRAINLEKWVTASARLGLIVLAFIAGWLTALDVIALTVSAPLVGGCVLIGCSWHRVRSAVRSSQDEGGTRRRIWSRVLSGGLRSWSQEMASLVNTRLDQTLMVTLTSTTQLGLYSVAVTLSDLPLYCADAVRTIAFAEANAGDRTHLIARSSRLLLLVQFGACLVAGAAGAVLIPWIFGADFRGTVPMFWILLAGGVPIAVSQVMASGLLVLDRQGRAAMAELVGILITVPGLFLFVPALGGIGAAMVSAVAYTVVCAVLVQQFARLTGRTVRSCLLANGSDFAWLRSQLMPGRVVRVPFRSTPGCEESPEAGRA